MVIFGGDTILHYLFENHNGTSRKFYPSEIRGDIGGQNKSHIPTLLLKPIPPLPQKGFALGDELAWFGGHRV
jgi:hypothetical protein